MYEVIKIGKERDRVGDVTIDTRVFRPFCWCHDMPSRRAPTHARALMAQRSGNVWRLRRTCYPLNRQLQIEAYTMSTRRCPRVRCPVAEPEASGAFSSEAQPSTVFHPRAANEEPDKVERPILDSTLAIEQSRPAGPNDEVDICVTRHFLRNLLDNLKDDRGQRENEG